MRKFWSDNIYYSNRRATLHHGDCMEVMASLPADSIDAIVTDPPYGLGFMGKKWDALPPGEEWARECLRVLKPGGHMLAFGGTRTWHRLAVAVEDAGFEIRDSIAWMYGSGFPKSHDVSKAIDKAAGAERIDAKHSGFTPFGAGSPRCLDCGKTKGSQSGNCRCVDAKSAPATPTAQHWEGWGTALKPAFEPVIMARKPFVGTVAANVLEHGTGAINIDACRVSADAADDLNRKRRPSVVGDTSTPFGAGLAMSGDPHASGRWPANVVLDDAMAEVLDGQSGTLRGGARPGSTANTPKFNGATYSAGKIYDGKVEGPREQLDGGGASRFFYVAKAPKKERPLVDGIAHPTVKPLALMRWLCRLVTPEGGTILDPFAGSGTTLEAAALEGFKAIGIEREADYLPLIQARLDRIA